MGSIRNGVYGAMSGKAGGLVGSKWKDTPYLRSYAIPKYTNTDPQKEQRGAFGATAKFARLLLGTIIPSLWNRMTTSMSGFNLFVKTNIGAFVGPSFPVTTSVLVGKGILEGVSGLGCTYTTATGALAITWDDNSAINNALSTDLPYVVIADTAGNVYTADLDDDVANQRSKGTLVFSIAPGLTPSNVICFLGFYRGSGIEFMNSNSTGVLCTAP